MEKLRIGITQGDINGTSYEIIIKALADNQLLELITPVIYGSSKIASYYRKLLEIQGFSVNIITQASEVNFKKINIINCTEEDVKVEMGRSAMEAGKAALQALDAAVADMKAGHLDALVTMPVNRQTIDSELFDFPGHTEYLSRHWEQPNEAMMILLHEALKVAILTEHLPLAKIPEILTQELIVKKVKTLAQVLTQDFAIVKPRIAVLGLNPHAGSGGRSGNEEMEIINPAIKKLNSEGYVCIGALKADEYFGTGYFRQVDAVLAIYHDQGMIPFKAITANMGVNYTANLPLIRTAPVHGVEYKQAGQNTADPQALRNAIYQAIDIWHRRKQHREISANPLGKK